MADEDPTNGFDIDGDGKTSPWEANLCRLCLTACLVLAFGNEAMALL